MAERILIKQTIVTGNVVYKPCEIFYSIKVTHREFCELSQLRLGGFTMVLVSGFEILSLLNMEANFRIQVYYLRLYCPETNEVRERE